MIFLSLKYTVIFLFLSKMKIYVFAFSWLEIGSSRLRQKLVFHTQFFQML